MNTTVPTPEPARDTKRADELEPGDHVAAFEFSEPGPCRVLSAHPYREGRTALVALTYARPDGRPAHIGELAADADLELATKAEIDGIGDAERRAKFIADLRAVADWFEARPWLPVPYSRRAQAKFVNEDDDDAKLTEARDLAAEFGVTAQIEADHVTVQTWIGGFEYVVYGTRPAPVPDDPTGKFFSREADDPTPTSSVPATVGGVHPAGRADLPPCTSVCSRPDGAEPGHHVDGCPRGAELTRIAAQDSGSVTGRASVPVLCAAVLADGVACGARIYWNVAANAWWHLWRQGDDTDVLKHTATGPSVPPEGGE